MRRRSWETGRRAHLTHGTAGGAADEGGGKGGPFQRNKTPNSLKETVVGRLPLTTLCLPLQHHFLLLPRLRVCIYATEQTTHDDAIFHHVALTPQP